MARIRTIKPEFFTSEDIVALSPLARLLYIAIWCEADKEGRMAWKPRTFKLRYFPGDACDIEALAAELVESGLVVLYGDGLAYVPSFAKHQHINPRESASTLPTPETGTRRDASARVGTRASTVSDGETTRREEGKGREVKAEPEIDSEPEPADAEPGPPVSRKAGGKATTIGTWVAACEAAGEECIPADDPIFRWAADAGIPLDFLALAWSVFVERHTESGKRQADWRATFRNAVRGNWYRLWWMDGQGTCSLTTVGQQVKRAGVAA